MALHFYQMNIDFDMDATKNKYEIYFSTNSILYINQDGELKRLYCPFQVRAKFDMPPIRKYDVVIVDAVKITSEGREVYIIEGKGYFMIYFRLV